MIHPFCNEVGQKHDRNYQITYYKGIKKTGIKQMKCRKCKRILVKNGKYVNPYPDRTKIKLTKEGRKILNEITLHSIRSEK